MYKVFAKIYDEFMKYADYDKWSELVENITREENIKVEKMLDIGCGTGELLLRIADTYECHGMDISEDMLKVAKNKLKDKKVDLFLGDMVDFNTGFKYDLITAFFDTINHILDIEDLKGHFKNVYNSLNDNGVYIFDVVSREFMESIFENGIYFDIREDLTIIWEHQIEEDIDYIDATYFHKKKGNNHEKYQETYSKKIYTPEEYESNIRNAGFTYMKMKVNNEIAGEREIYILKKEKL